MSSPKNDWDPKGLWAPYAPSDKVPWDLRRVVGGVRGPGRVEGGHRAPSERSGYQNVAGRGRSVGRPIVAPTGQRDMGNS